MKRKAKKNGTMMVVGAMNPGPKYREYIISKKAADKIDPDRGARAESGHKRFHKNQSTRVRVFEYDDGNDEVENIFCFKVGKAQVEIDTVKDASGKEVRIKPLKIGTVYSVPRGAKSDKAGKQWIHSHREDGGTPPIHVVDVDTGIQSQLGGTYVHDDWMRR